MDREMQKKSQSSSESIFGDINDEMIESGKNLRRKLNFIIIFLLVVLVLFIFYLFF